MDIRQIAFTDINTAKLLDKEIPDDLAPDEVAVRTVYSTVSAGTERANITGDPSVSAGASHGTVFPRILGYCSSGNQYSSFAEGDVSKVVIGQN